MYCHQCGERAHGAFCSQCGTKIIAADAAEREVARLAVESEPILIDWSNEVCYDVLLRQPQVRELVARHAARAPKRMSEQEFLDLCDKALTPLAGFPVAKVVSIAQPIYARLGVKTGKNREEFFLAPVGRVLVATICTLAELGQSPTGVEQAEDGCVLRAKIPCDIWSMSGEMVIAVRRMETGATVEAATIIQGQLYDWGKSKRMLATLFDGIHRNASADNGDNRTSNAGFGRSA